MFTSIQIHISMNYHMFFYSWQTASFSGSSFPRQFSTITNGKMIGRRQWNWRRSVATSFYIYFVPFDIAGETNTQEIVK